MNGAESLVHTLLASDVDVCFANPGTSEMHFVAALDRIEGMRCVLGLFEGVVTAAADGYWRMARKPAATLLHLGPGLANGNANIHNAKRAGSGMVNIVGDHATYHKVNDAPLNSDVEGTARPYSHWVRTSKNANEVAADAAEAIQAAKSAHGQIATLILPADTAWNESAGPAVAKPPAPLPRIDRTAIRSAVGLLNASTRTGLFLGGRSICKDALEIAGRIAAKTGATILTSVGVPRQERGAGSIPTRMIPYAIDAAMAVLSDFDHVIMIGATPPVAFFAYPNKATLLKPDGCEMHHLAGPGDDVVDALARLAEEVGATRQPFDRRRLDPPPLATGAFTRDNMCQSIAALIPENAILCDEAVPYPLPAHSLHSRPHSWMRGMGGSIGWAMPAAVGAAIACPDRKVMALAGDGSAAYTLQALWTQAREQLDVTNIVFANRSYAVLRGELERVGAGKPGARAEAMLGIGNPDIHWAQLAGSFGVEGKRVENMDSLNRELSAALSNKGPHLIEIFM